MLRASCIILYIFCCVGLNAAQAQGSQAIYGVQKAHSDNLTGVRKSKNILGSKNSTHVINKGSQKFPQKAYGASKFNSRVYSEQGGLSHNAFGKSDLGKDPQERKSIHQKQSRDWGNIENPPDGEFPDIEEETKPKSSGEIGKF